MLSRPHGRLILLFLLAVLLPCATMVVFSLRVLRQERELGEKRLDDERARAVQHLRDVLSSRLEAIASHEAERVAASAPDSAPGPADPAVRLVTRLEGGRPVLPWEVHDLSAVARALDEGEFGARLREGELHDLYGGEPARATAAFREAVRAAHSPVQAAYARLALAGALLRSGRADEAHELYGEVLELPVDLTDEHGVPLTLYAAAALVSSVPSAVAARTAIYTRATCRLSPTALYMLRDVLDALPTSGSEVSAGEDARAGLVAERIERMEQTLALARAFPALGLSPPPSRGQRRWVTFGDAGWLLSARSMGQAEGGVLVAVDAHDALQAARELVPVLAGQDAAVRLVRDPSPPVRLLGAEFPGLGVEVSWTGGAATEAEARLARWFNLGTLTVVLCVTLFGAYVLARDVRRELRLAEMRSHFVSSVSHELKTPLTAIRMFAETLLLDRSLEPDARRECVEIVVNESERLTRLLDNVLDLSKIERGQKVYRFHPVDLTEIIEHSARIMKYSLEQGRFRLRVEAADGSTVVVADADALEQAVLNLLTNAMKYSGESREIDLRLLRHDGAAVIEVVDRGPGIPPEAMGHLTEKFYRVPATVEAGIPGTGLGLTLVDHIAVAHGGRLEVESAQGRGSTFSIHLPLSEARLS